MAERAKNAAAEDIFPERENPILKVSWFLKANDEAPETGRYIFSPVLRWPKLSQIEEQQAGRGYWLKEQSD